MGFGFADAMFGIKDITAEYGDIEAQDQKLEEYPLSQLTKPVPNNTQKANQNKATLVKREPIPQKQQNVKIENKGMRQPEIFKVNPGK